MLGSDAKLKRRATLAKADFLPVGKSAPRMLWLKPTLRFVDRGSENQNMHDYWFHMALLLRFIASKCREAYFPITIKGLIDVHIHLYSCLRTASNFPINKHK